MLIFLALTILVAGCGKPASQPKAMLAEELNCPEGSQPQIERWGGLGENGWLHVCKMKHGLFTAWHGEVKAVEGNYVNGQEEGLWQFWDEQGNKYKEITYKNGTEIAVRSFK